MLEVVTQNSVLYGQHLFRASCLDVLAIVDVRLIILRLVLVPGVVPGREVLAIRAILQLLHRRRQLREFRRRIDSSTQTHGQEARQTVVTPDVALKIAHSWKVLLPEML